jgi:itaconate CoA-transferase
MIAVNTILELDLTGQCNAEHMVGSQFSGTGGQLDFVRGAFNSRGGKSIQAFTSTARKGAISRIVPLLRSGTAVSTPRMDVQYLVTEFGSVNLKGKSTRERALGIISLAHPDFRERLLKAAEDMYLL